MEASSRTRIDHVDEDCLYLSLLAFSCGAQAELQQMQGDVVRQASQLLPHVGLDLLQPRSPWREVRGGVKSCGRCVHTRDPGAYMAMRSLIVFNY